MSGLLGKVYPSRDGWHVSLTLFGEEVDDAGPFDDESDATEAACRMSDEVETWNGPGWGNRGGSGESILLRSGVGS